MRIDSSRASAILSSSFGQNGIRALQAQQLEESRIPQRVADQSRLQQTGHIPAQPGQAVQGVNQSEQVFRPSSAFAVDSPQAVIAPERVLQMLTSVALFNSQGMGAQAQGVGDGAQDAENQSDLTELRIGPGSQEEQDGADQAVNGEDAPENDPRVAAQINQLRQTERDVIAHEAAHKAVGGQYAGAVSYSYTTGPDGRRYITGGEVSISTPSTDDPREALRMAEQVIRAALAPADPSSQDIAVAASSGQVAARARADIAALAREEAMAEQEESGEADSPTGIQFSNPAASSVSANAVQDASSLSDIGANPEENSMMGESRNQSLADIYQSFSDMSQFTANPGRQIYAIG